MARLGKLVKTLKIGIGTATDFLKSKGFTVEEDFNAKITGEQETLLLKEFATPEMLAEFEAQKKEPKKAKVEESKKEVKAPTKDQKKVEVKVEPQFNVVGKIDLDALNKPKVEKKEEPKIETKAESKTIEAQKVVSQIVEVKKEEPKKEVAPIAHSDIPSRQLLKSHQAQ